VLTLVRQKRQADEDANLLANRILMLDNEQSKMLKKIEKTRIQADKLLVAQKNNEERAKRLEEEKERQESAIMAKQLRVLQDRKQRKLIRELVTKSNQERVKVSGK
jgi:hypothetical protein